MKLRNISWIPAIILMVLIFNFSSKPAAVSEDSSLGIAKIVYQLYEGVNENADTARKELVLSYIDHLVRKTAHFTEYAVLSLCLAFHLWACGAGKLKLYGLSVALSAVYAMTDEFHQLFVDGRAARFTDCLIDTSGAALGGVLFLLFLYGARRAGQRRGSH